MENLQSQEIIDPEQVVEEEVSQTTGDKGVPAEPSPDVAEPKKTKVQERIGQLTKEKWDARREAEYWKNQAAKRETPPTEVSSDRPKPPLETEFSDTEEYRKARVEYEDKLDAWRERGKRTQEIQFRQKQEHEDNLAKYNLNAERMRAKYQDFDETVNSPVFTPELSVEILASEYAPEIGYYLAKNPAEAQRISSLSLNAIAREIGRLESKFTEGKSRLISGAPKPLTTVAGNDIVTKDPSKMTDDEWYRWDKQEKIKKIKLKGE